MPGISHTHPPFADEFAIINAVRTAHEGQSDSEIAHLARKALAGSMDEPTRLCLQQQMQKQQ